MSSFLPGRHVTATDCGGLVGTSVWRRLASIDAADSFALPARDHHFRTNERIDCALTCRDHTIMLDNRPRVDAASAVPSG